MSAGLILPLITAVVIGLYICLRTIVLSAIGSQECVVVSATVVRLSSARRGSSRSSAGDASSVGLSVCSRMQPDRPRERQNCTITIGSL